MPDHADAPVARLTTGALSCFVAASWLRDAIGLLLALGRPQCLCHGDVDGVELMVTGHFLGHASAARVLEDDEIPHEVKQSPLVKDPFEHHL